MVVALMGYDVGHISWAVGGETKTHNGGPTLRNLLCTLYSNVPTP